MNDCNKRRAACVVYSKFSGSVFDNVEEIAKRIAGV